MHHVKLRRWAIGCLVLAGLLGLQLTAARAEDKLGDTGVKGAGSTFAYPLLTRWSREYRDWNAKGGEYPLPSGGLDDALPSSALEYEAIGSLAGTERVRQHAVDFGATDMPLSAAELGAAGLAQFPFVIGGVVVAVNVKGLGASELRLTGPVLAQIFLGQVQSWSDPAIKALNPGLQLPAAPIRIVHRADGSGTTYNFSEYLSRVSPEWKTKVGAGLLIKWPTGFAAKGNEGVAKAIVSTENAIGYVEYAQATLLNLKQVALQNRAGQFVAPSPTSFQAAAANVDWSANTAFNTLLIDQPDRGAYPITATVFALLHKKPLDARAETALEFFRYGLDHGANSAARLGYVPLPPKLVQQVKNYWQVTLH